MSFVALEKLATDWKSDSVSLSWGVAVLLVLLVVLVLFVEFVVFVEVVLLAGLVWFPELPEDWLDVEETP